ncbi:hypothetical protein HY967_01245 [Candidatus Jorgensenbacteria bacterium]|nr:hypothetical protein [Candidatus Jorgensenbacteria bacterium]
MNKEEKEVVRNALRYLKIARRSEVIVYNAMLSGETFRDEVLGPLESICEWNEKDEQEVDKAAKEFQKATEGHTLKERADKLAEFLKDHKWWAIGIGVATVIGGIAYYVNRKGNGDPKEEKKNKNTGR